MEVKLAVTVCDCSHVVHAGGDTMRVTSLIVLREDQIPPNLRQFLRDAAEVESLKKERGHAWFYQSLTISLVDERKLSERCDGNHSGPKCDDPECWSK